MVEELLEFSKMEDGRFTLRMAVSYTHLDVYKRQVEGQAGI